MLYHRNPNLLSVAVHNQAQAAWNWNRTAFRIEIVLHLCSQFVFWLLYIVWCLFSVYPSNSSMFSFYAHFRAGFKGVGGRWLGPQASHQQGASHQTLQIFFVRDVCAWLPVIQQLRYYWLLITVFFFRFNKPLSFSNCFV